MTTKFDELVAKLTEIFQIDKPELDFGVYKVINAKAGMIRDFLNNDLKQKVQAALTSKASGARQQKLDELTAHLKTLAEIEDPNPEGNPKTQRLRKELAALDVADDSESLVYAHLLTFFSRYYDDGDFISKRRYKEGQYVIPYSGEEVKLHWANADQYYTKSGENFTNYDFKLDNGKKVHFKLVAAATAKDNIKDNDCVRSFTLWVPEDDSGSGSEELEMCVTLSDSADDGRAGTPCPPLPDKSLEEKDGELYIYFQYGKFPKGTKKNEILAATIAAVKDLLAQDATLLATYNLLAPVSKDDKRTVFEKQFARYTAKNTSDYFIHKDLRGFLTRELNSYVTNEMMNLDDISNAATFDAIAPNLRLIQTFRTIATELIGFMAQLEDFQKKLWLKKKFVVQCDWCVTISKLEEEIASLKDRKDAADAPRIADIEALIAEAKANPEQQAEWEKWGVAADPKAADMMAIDARMIDTKFFDERFKARLLRALPDLDKQCDGVLVHSENFQALNLICDRYCGQIQSVYIDPPYNTGSDGFLYRDAYKHSSWLTLMVNRLDVAKMLMSKTAGIYVNVNDIEDSRLHCAMNYAFGEDGYITTVITKCSTVSSFRTVNPGPVDISDRIIIFAKDKEAYSYKSQPVVKRVDLSHFSRYVVNKEESPERWRFESIKLRVLNNLGFVCATANEGVKEARSKLGRAADAIIQAECESFAVEHAEAVFETKTFQKPSSWLVGIIEQSKKNPEQIVVAEREGNAPIVMVGGRQFYFLSNNVQIINGVKEVTEPASTIWTDIDTNNLKHEGGVAFANGKKPIKLLSRIINMSSNGEGRCVLDYFGGSGTTAHAVISLNREDDGHRKYILVEMGDHFDTVLKPRIEKVVYSPEWKDGKPVSSTHGISHCFKYLTLESYEDTLNNLKLETPKGAELGIGKNEYMMNYMLDIESRASLLSVNKLRHPFDYTLDIAIDSSGATAPRKVDLVETFNYLVGLTVEAEDRHIDKGYALVTGTLPSGEDAIILWRDCDTVDNAKLREILAKQAINPRAQGFVLYVNGDHDLPNSVKGDDGAEKTIKVASIDAAFLEKMFAEE